MSNSDEKREISNISDLVCNWCDEKNKANHTNIWIFLMLLGFSFGIFFIIWSRSPIWFILSILSVAIYSLCAPKHISYGDLRSSEWQNKFVPDSLIEKIADNSDIPLHVKSKIAEILTEKNGITFREIFEEEYYILESTKNKYKNGYQKIMAFKKSSEKNNTVSMIEKEPSIIINGITLTSAQAISVRNAISSYINVLSTEGLGDDENGKAITAGYIERLNEVQKLIFLKE